MSRLLDFFMKLPLLKNRYYNLNVRIHKPRTGEIFSSEEDLNIQQLQISWDKGRIVQSEKENLFEIELLKNKARFPLPSNDYFYIDTKGKQYLNVFNPKYKIFVPLQPFKIHISKENLGELRTILKMEGYKAYTIAKMKQTIQLIKKPSVWEKYLPLISVTLLIVVFVLGMIFQGKYAIDIYNAMSGVANQLSNIAKSLNLNQTLPQNLTIVPGG